MDNYCTIHHEKETYREPLTVVTGTELTILNLCSICTLVITSKFGYAPNVPPETINMFLKEYWELKDSVENGQRKLKDLEGKVKSSKGGISGVLGSLVKLRLAVRDSRDVLGEDKVSRVIGLVFKIDEVIHE